MILFQISSGIAAWLFALKSFGLVPLPKSSHKRKGEKEKEKEGEGKEKEKQEEGEKGENEEKVQLPDTPAFKKHLQFLNRFVYSKKQQHRTYNKVGEERKKSGGEKK